MDLHVAHDGVRGAPDPLIAQQSARFTSGDEEDLSDGRRGPIGGREEAVCLDKVPDFEMFGLLRRSSP